MARVYNWDVTQKRKEQEGGRSDRPVSKSSKG